MKPNPIRRTVRGLSYAVGILGFGCIVAGALLALADWRVGVLVALTGALVCYWAWDVSKTPPPPGGRVG